MARYLATCVLRIDDDTEARLEHDVTTDPETTPGRLLDALIAELTSRDPDQATSVTLALTLTALPTKAT